MPHPKRFLDLLVPRQSLWWEAFGDTLRGLTWQPSSSSRYSPCGRAIAEEYLAAALCPADATMAPPDGYAYYAEVVPGRLEAMALAATARKLSACGVELDIHLQLGELQAPTTLQPCEGVACREQCTTWEASNYLRFSCDVAGLSFPAATASGHATEPALHTVVSCRLPWQVLPKWLGGRAPENHLFVELRELDGVFAKSMHLKVCPYPRPRRTQKIAFCVRPVVAAGKLGQLLDDWLTYHRLMGLEHVFLYDVDGTLEPLLASGTAAELRRTEGLTYVKHFLHRVGRRVSALDKDVWRNGLVGICGDNVQVNHCLALARSAGYEWFVHLRGLDKFLHSDADPSPGMVRRVLEQQDQLQTPYFQVLRRHCGVTDLEAMQSAASISAAVGLGVPVFSQYQRCEPVQLSIDNPLRDDSWVPVMKPHRVDLVMTNRAVDFNKSGTFCDKNGHVSCIRCCQTSWDFEGGYHFHGRRVSKV